MCYDDSKCHKKQLLFLKIQSGGGHSVNAIEVINSRLPLSLKMTVNDQFVLPVMTYEAETWELTRHLEIKLSRSDEPWQDGC